MSTPPNQKKNGWSYPVSSLCFDFTLFENRNIGIILGVKLLNMNFVSMQYVYIVDYQ